MLARTPGQALAMWSLATLAVVSLRPALSPPSPSSPVPHHFDLAAHYRGGPTWAASLHLRPEAAADRALEDGDPDRTDDWVDRAEFEHLSVEDGLSQSTVNAILQDSRGFMWFGTNDGLNRYDGYEVVVYHADPHGRRGLSDDRVTALVEDSSGHLWIGTGRGLDRFDLEKKTFRHVPDDDQRAEGLGDKEVRALCEDATGTLWVGTSSGLRRLDPSGDRFIHYRADSTGQRGLPDDRVTALYPDRSGAIWVGTWTGIARWEPEADVFIPYQLPTEQTSGQGQNAVYAIAEDREGTVWVGTDGSGLYRLDSDAHHFTRVPVASTGIGQFAPQHIRSLWCDESGLLWLGTKGGGLVCLDGEAAWLTSYAKDPRISTSLSSDYVNAVYESRYGVLWIGTAGGGVSKLDRDKQKFALHQADPSDPASLSHNRVLAVWEDEQGLIWIGTDGGGLNGFDPQAGAFRHFTHDPEDPYSLSNNCVTAIHQGDGGNLWVGTWGGGIASFHRETGRFVHFQADPYDPESLGSNWVRAIHEDAEGMLWIGSDQGLGQFDHRAGRFVTWDSSGGEVRAIYEDPNRDLWYGTDRGLRRLDRNSLQVTQYRVGEDGIGTAGRSAVHAVHQDNAGTIWVGTDSGVARLDEARSTFTFYTEADGLADDLVLGILGDERGFLWLSTAGGLSRFDPVAGVFRNYGVSDGLQGYEFTSAGCQTQDGTLYIGGINGLNSFHPAEFKDNPYPPAVHLTSLTQAGREVPRTVSQTSGRAVRLSWPNNYFEFSFVGLNYHQPEKNQYAYRLLNFDREWNEVGTQRFGRYTNLPGGTYDLQIRASNNDGVWNDTGVTIPVVVVPPFWATWWFRVGIVLALGIAATGAYRLRVRGIASRSRDLEVLVADRTAALSEANEQLRQEIAERQRAEAELAHRAAEAAVAAERSRLARDLHDAVTQLLFSASLIAEALPSIWENDQEEGRELLAEMRRLSRGALAEMRTLLLELRPAALTETGLVELLHQLAEAATGRSDLSVTVAAHRDPSLPHQVHIALYRIAQEALNNVVKHARADQAKICLRCLPAADAGNGRKCVTLSVKDDGCGFNPHRVLPDHMGLNIIRERAERVGATLSIQSEPGQGTEVMVRWTEQQ